MARLDGIENLLHKFETEWRSGKRRPLEILLKEADEFAAVAIRDVGAPSDQDQEVNEYTGHDPWEEKKSEFSSILDDEVGSLTIQLTRQVDALCDEFEQALTIGAPPPLQEFLQRIDSVVRKPLLRNLAELELDYWVAQGCEDPIGQICRRNPELSDQLNMILSETATKEELSGKSMCAISAGTQTVPGRVDVHCPHCEQSTEFALDTRQTHLSCPSCGNQYSLLLDEANPGETQNFRPIKRLNVGDRIGKYTVRRLLGAGSFGSVYLCSDPDLKREVAIKVAHAHKSEGSASFQTQLAEAQRVASLDCPGVVPVFEGGRTEEGRHFFVMKYIRGKTLDHWLHDHHPTAVESAALIARIAEILAAVHAYGVIHRDLKPSNIIVDYKGNPFVADFGLAQTESDLEKNNQPHVLVGTPAYMAPEQIMPVIGAADARTDVWALGVILYQLLTGRRPFVGENLWATCEAIVGQPVAFEHGDANIAAGLKRVCLKCLERLPEKRFASAAELANALWRQCPARMRPGPVNKRKTIAAVVGIAALAIAASVWMVARARRQAETVRQAASVQVSSVEDELYMLDMVKAYDFWQRGWPDQVQEVLDRQQPKTGTPDRRGFEWHLLSSLVQPPEPVAVLSGHAGAVNELAVFPDGRRIASVGADGTLRVWDVQTEECLTTIDMAKSLPKIDLEAGGLHSVAISPDGRYVAAGADVVGIVDTENEYQVRKLYHSNRNVDAIAFSADGQRLALGTRYNNLAVVTFAGDLVASVPNTSRMRTIEYLADRNMWLVPYRHLVQDKHPEKVAKLWSGNLDQVENVYDCRPHLGYTMLTCARVSPCGRFVGAADEGLLYLFSAKSGTLLDSSDQQRAYHTDFCFSDDGTSIACTYLDGQIGNLKLKQSDDRIAFQSQVQTFKAHIGEALCIRSLDADHLVSAGTDGLIKTWTCRRETDDITVPLPSSAGCEFSSDGRRLLVSGGRDLVILHGTTGEIEYHRSFQHSDVNAFWSPSGDRIVVGAPQERKVWLLNLQDDQLTLLCQPDFRPNQAKFSPDGRIVAITGGSYLSMLDHHNGHELCRRPLPGGASNICFSHDGTLLASGGMGHLAVWDLPQGISQDEILEASGIQCMAFSPDDSVLATGHNDSVIRLWNVADRTPLAELKGHEHTVRSLSFSPDSRSLISTGDDGTLRIWSIPARRSLGIIDQADGLWTAAISPNGRLLAISYNDNQSESTQLVIRRIDSLSNTRP